jgi:hypothetical protein
MAIIRKTTTAITHKHTHQSSNNHYTTSGTTQSKNLRFASYRPQQMALQLAQNSKSQLSASELPRLLPDTKSWFYDTLRRK